MAGIFKLACITIFVTSVLACSSAARFRADLKQAKGDGDGRRPTEQGEGVVGYLRDPASLKYERKQGVIHINGAEQAVAAEKGAVNGLAVCLQAIDQNELINRISRDKRVGGQGVANLAESTVNADGSFKLEAPEGALLPQDSVLSLNVTGQCRNGGISTVSRSNQIVLMSLSNEGTFVDSLVVFEAYSKASSVEVYPVRPWQLPEAVDLPFPRFCDPGENCSIAFKLVVNNGLTGKVLNQNSQIQIKLCYDGMIGDNTCITMGSGARPWPSPDEELRLPEGRLYRIFFDSPNYEAVAKEIPLDIQNGVLAVTLMPAVKGLVPDVSAAQPGPSTSTIPQGQAASTP